MERFVLRMMAGLFLLAAGPLHAASHAHGPNPGGQAREHWSEQGEEHGNAQFRADSSRGEERADERMDEHGEAHGGGSPDSDQPGDAPHGAKAKGQGPKPR